MTEARPAGNKVASGVLMSIRTRHVRSIVAGTKTYELRRKIPRGAEGMRIFIYSSGEEMAVTAQARVAEVDSGTPESIWFRHSRALGISRVEFDEYFAGAKVAYALQLQDVRKHIQPISLLELRMKFGIEPPQSWRYLTEGVCERLMGDSMKLN
ncbi:hypothetical protein IG195_11185 [Arthrobacter sp. TES]|uniref:hypothetical protein n=1 Tax=Paenarthrobacter ureafaciens TaxID=37931 RepID=UPI0003977B6E|nr:hypothetical protein [Paenarthrobacter ureafaciens]MCX8455651.1 hypothetical protein [Paenarthrobacter ureafaciens]MCY0973843.1 hypothetical protein [Paenarthrobacter ureafaciens]QOI62156.1 hypothetical protein IG195_11185 [Arthrobacter sp. TES]